MFTGIVEHRGTVSRVGHHEGVTSMTIDTGPLSDLAVGGSISVNGVCLTAVAVEEAEVSVEVVSETLRRTNLASVDAGDPVNLERAMVAGGRFDGHIVQGHIDGVGHVSRVAGSGGELRMSIEVSGDLMRYIVPKGSVTVDGVSLTVAETDGSVFDVAIIPHTAQATTLGLRKAEDPVNLEVDVLAKYVERLLEHR